MIIRFRSARVAGLALALATPMVLAGTAPAFASGESTSAVLTAPTSGSATVFTWAYTFSANGGHGLSNIAIGFCSAAILADVATAGPGGEIFLTGDVPGQHGGFGPGIKFDRDASQETGTLTVTFNSPHPISDGGLRIQSHSGDGNDPDETKLAKGPGPCPGDPDPTPDPDPIPDPIPDPDPILDPIPTPDPELSISKVTPPVVLPATVEQAKASPPVLDTLVFGEKLVAAPELVAGAELPRTGAGHLTSMLKLAGMLLVTGIALTFASRRRRVDACSASFPG